MIIVPAGYLDSHCHLQKQHPAAALDGVLERARSIGVARMFCNATREEDWQAVVELAARECGIIPFLGIHPWFAETAVTGWEDRLLARLQQVPAGIGETGLDKCCRADFGRQQQIFLLQLQMASELRRPLVIHCVRAWGRLLEILEHFAGPLPRVMIHTFAGSHETLQRLLRLGCFISFSGRLVTDSRVHPCCLATPLAKLLLETDSPGRPLARDAINGLGTTDEPAAIATLYELAATMREMDLDKFRQEIWENGKIFTDTILPR